MKQILQNLGTGITEVVEVPCPQIKPGHLLIRTHSSLISAGTERMLVDFGKANLLNKARQQPDKIRMVKDKIKTDGILPTLESIRNKLDAPIPMGYCNVGEVIEVGDQVSGFSVGDWVASNGCHAEIVLVPKNLCVKIPENVDAETASFAVLGAISLQGIRLLQPTLGEVFAVTGLGLLGILAVQLLRAQGCKVLGLDFDANRLELAHQFGAEPVFLAKNEDPLKTALAISKGRGLDGVLITTSTSSNEPVQQAAQMCRKRGRIVLVGTAGLEISRADFYEKELSFQVSCSYGPGRYDENYEKNGNDYPLPYVRWTEQRNIEAVLEMMSERNIFVEPLITHRFPILQAADAYQLISKKQQALGILLQYSSPKKISSDTLQQRHVEFSDNKASINTSVTTIGFIGAGNYATQVLIPAFKKTGVPLIAVASQTGVSAVHAVKKFGFYQATTDTQAVIADPNLNTIVITTRHNTHAELVSQALQAGKNVFVEKPLALTHSELNKIISVYNTPRDFAKPYLMVGFNRRFAPHIVKIKSLLSTLRESKTIVITINAGEIPLHHWAHNLEIGGGRIVGEACHFIDLLRHLVAAPIRSYQVENLGATKDKATITLKFSDGSIGTIHYFANGHKAFPKERIEIFCEGKILQLDNFRSLRGYGWKRFKKLNLWRQDKGQNHCVKAFTQAIQNVGNPLIPFEELIEVSRTSIDIAEAIQHCE